MRTFLLALLTLAAMVSAAALTSSAISLHRLASRPTIGELKHAESQDERKRLMDLMPHEPSRTVDVGDVLGEVRVSIDR